MKPSRKRAIREKCLDCCCGNAAYVRKCTAVSCPLWYYRMGKVPKTDNSTDFHSGDEMTQPEDDDD